jgi:hypothetical protein
MARPAVLRFAILLAGIAAAAPVWATEPGVVEEVLAILHERGLVDESEYQRLRARQAAWARNQTAGPEITWHGDFRARFEQFWFDRDPLGVERGNRSRARYRLRLGATVDVNPHISATFRLASGGASRSANQTLGVGDDFDPDGLYIDRAHLDLAAPESWLTFGGSARLRIGKMGVPFRWKQGPDSMLWDRDLSPEGVSLAWSSDDLGGVRAYARAAYLVLDENSRARDPHVLGLQGGASFEPGEGWVVGGRMSHYWWRSLDADFLDRSAASGNLRFGLNDSGEGGNGISATELAAYARWSGVAGWPLLLYGHVVRNHDASDSPAHPGASDEDLGFGFGAELGDKRHLAKLHLGYFRLQANAWPSRFVDSPLLAGRSNQQVVVVQALREVLAGTDLKVSLFFGEPLERGSAFSNSLSDSDRVLLQTDLVVRF